MMRDVLGVRLTVFEGIDQVGLDVALAIEEHYSHARPGQIPPEPAALLRKMVSEGKLGKKSGEGFCEYLYLIIVLDFSLNFERILVKWTKPGEAAPPTDKLVFLDIFKGEINICNTDGKDIKNIVSGLKTMPDGIQVDTRPGKILLQELFLPQPASHSL